MSIEGQIRDKKSLRAVTGKSADFSELVKDGVVFATSVHKRYLYDHRPTT